MQVSFRGKRRCATDSWFDSRNPWRTQSEPETETEVSLASCDGRQVHQIYESEKSGKVHKNKGRGEPRRTGKDKKGIDVRAPGKMDGDAQRARTSGERPRSSSYIKPRARPCAGCPAFRFAPSRCVERRPRVFAGHAQGSIRWKRCAPAKPRPANRWLEPRTGRTSVVREH